jgi:hypothetical protein
VHHDRDDWCEANLLRLLDLEVVLRVMYRRMRKAIRASLVD